MCRTYLANALKSLNQMSEAMTQYQEVTRIRRSIDPRRLPGITLRLAESLTNEAMVLWGQNHSQADHTFREAERIMLSIPPDHRDKGDNIALSLGRIYANWGDCSMT